MIDLKNIPDCDLTAKQFKAKYLNKRAKQRAQMVYDKRMTLSDQGMGKGQDAIDARNALKRKRQPVMRDTSLDAGALHKRNKPHAGRIVPRHEWGVQ